MKEEENNNLTQHSRSAILILNWNGAEDTIECLKSIQQHCTGEDFFVVVVDNNSNDGIGSITSIKWNMPVEYIKNIDNKGFAAGNNIGIKECLKKNPDYILLLNNDIVLVDNLLAGMTAVMDNFRDIGVAGAINYFFSHPSEIWQAGSKVSLISGKIGPVSLNSTNQFTEADYVPGSSYMIRSSIIPEVGLLDENFFAYCEEIDFSLRVKKAGFKVVCLSDSKVLHKIGQSSSNPAKEYLRLRNKLYLFQKHGKRLANYFIFPLLIIKSIVKSALRVIHNRETDYFRALYFAIKDYISNKMGKGAFEKFHPAKQ